MTLRDESRSDRPMQHYAIFLTRVTSTPARHVLFVILFFSILFVAFFSPVVLGGKFLAIGGDGLYIHLPNFYSSKVSWDLMTFGGFPMMADPEVRAWYPPAMLLSLLPGSWNVFVILAFVAASSFLYGYVFTITESRFAALVSGIVFGLSGFMLAQLGNAVIIHSTAWALLIIWSLERLRRRLRIGWFAAGSVGVAFCLLGGQPQIFFYAMILAGAYALSRGWTPPAGRWRYYSVSLLMVFLGTSLAAIQILPTRELLSQSLRAGFSFQDFTSYSLPRRQILTLIFPYAFGGLSESGFVSYFGRENQTELTGYVGLLPLSLSALALIVSKRKSIILFWLGAALLAFFLALGDATPLARLVYHIPILKNFRVPARHFMEFTIAVSVLSGLGAAAIIKDEVSRKLIRRMIGCGIVAMLACLTVLFLNSSHLAALAAQNGIRELSLRPWANRAVGIPLIVFVLGLVALIFWHKRPASIMRSALLIAVLIIDLGSFGFFYQWRYFSVDKNALLAPPSATQFKESLNATNQRLMSYRGYRGLPAEMPACLTRLWGVPSAGGYNALILKRVSDLTPTIDQPDTQLPWVDPDNRNLDLMAVRYLVLPPAQSSQDEHGVSWLTDDMQLWLGNGCSQTAHKSASLVLPMPIASSAMKIVSRLACSVQIPDGAAVARVRLLDHAGREQVENLVAGRDTSEWAYDCASVRAQMRHQRGVIFKSFPAMLNDEHCQGHSYVTTLSLRGISDVKMIAFDWLGDSNALVVDKLTLVDESGRSSFPIDPTLLTGSAWRKVDLPGEARVYENIDAMPRAWLASEALALNPTEILKAIKTGKLPDGRDFNRYQTALVEIPVALKSQTADKNASASVVSLKDTHMEVRTSSTTDSFLVTSDAYYPGWRANIDGWETEIYRTDYAIRGLPVPAGQHVVQFDYGPRSLYYGATISTLAIVILGGLLATSVFRHRFRLSRKG